MTTKLLTSYGNTLLESFQSNWNSEKEFHQYLDSASHINHLKPKKVSLWKTDKNNSDASSELIKSSCDLTKVFFEDMNYSDMNTVLYGSRKSKDSAENITAQFVKAFVQSPNNPMVSSTLRCEDVISKTHISAIKHMERTGELKCVRH